MQIPPIVPGEPRCVWPQGAVITLMTGPYPRARKKYERSVPMRRIPVALVCFVANPPSSRHDWAAGIDEDTA